MTNAPIYILEYDLTLIFSASQITLGSFLGYLLEYDLTLIFSASQITLGSFSGYILEYDLALANIFCLTNNSRTIFRLLIRI